MALTYQGPRAEQHTMFKDTIHGWNIIFSKEFEYLNSEKMIVQMLAPNLSPEQFTIPSTIGQHPQQDEQNAPCLEPRSWSSMLSLQFYKGLTEIFLQYEHSPKSICWSRSAWYPVQLKGTPQYLNTTCHISHELFLTWIWSVVKDMF